MHILHCSYHRSCFNIIRSAINAHILLSMSQRRLFSHGQAEACFLALHYVDPLAAHVERLKDRISVGLQLSMISSRTKTQSGVYSCTGVLFMNIAKRTEEESWLCRNNGQSPQAPGPPKTLNVKLYRHHSDARQLTKVRSMGPQYGPLSL